MCGRIIPTAILVLVSLSGAVQAQNLLNNSAYHQAVQLRSEAQSAFSNGNYDQAEKLSKEAGDYAKQAVEIAQQLALGYRAVNLLNIAKARIKYGESIKAPARYPANWTTAQRRLSVAQADYTAKAFTKSMVASRAVLDALKDIQPPPAASPAAAQSQQVLPKYYVVRLIPNRRDCFWRIAGYPFVYNDSFKWRILYRANKSVLQDPNNPNLIQPGMVFLIPSIHGEKRKGTYDPNGRR